MWNRKRDFLSLLIDKKNHLPKEGKVASVAIGSLSLAGWLPFAFPQYTTKGSSFVALEWERCQMENEKGYLAGYPVCENGVLACEVHHAILEILKKEQNN